jgi:hypothetical protein
MMDVIQKICTMTGEFYSKSNKSMRQLLVEFERL